MTEAERQVWQILRLHQMHGYEFRRQVPIGRYAATLPTLCHEARLIMEIDGVHETIADELGRITPTQTLPLDSRGRAFVRCRP
jgi:very-short-patch-repair endonuclease